MIWIGESSSLSVAVDANFMFFYACFNFSLRKAYICYILTVGIKVIYSICACCIIRINFFLYVFICWKMGVVVLLKPWFRILTPHNQMILDFYVCVEGGVKTKSPLNNGYFIHRIYFLDVQFKMQNIFKQLALLIWLYKYFVPRQVQ